MRTIFDDQDIQNKLKAIFEKYHCDYVVTDYWDEFIDFLKNPATTFGDLPNILLDVYSIEEEKLSNIVVDILSLLDEHSSELTDFFKTKTIQEIKSEQEAMTQGQNNQAESGQGSPSTISNQGAVSRNSLSTRVSKSNFYFSPEDEEEIRKIGQQTTNSNQQKMDAIYDRVAEDVVRNITIK